MNVGRVIQGRYRLQAMLGQGGMGSVWRAVHIELGTPVAVKLIDPSVADSKVALGRFKREAQSAASLRGTNVVQVLDYGIDDDVPYIVMELLEGESLAARLSRAAPLSAIETSRILVQVGKALARAHALNIVHRDLKPDNIFIVRDGDEEVTKVLDFGIAKTLSPAAFEASIHTKSGAILGTPHYMSPEQAAGRSSVDHRSDIWSLGVIAFECLTGCRPFNGSTLGGLVLAICTEPIPKPSDAASVPRGIDEWFGRCVCRDQAARFQTITDAINTLRGICDPPMVSSRPEPMWDNGGRELTLQNSPESTMRTPASEKVAWNGFSNAPLETVSAASRTLGTLSKRRSVVAYVALALLLVVVAFWGIAAMNRRIEAASVASGAMPSSTGMPLGNAAASLVPREPMLLATGATMASASPVPSITVQVVPSAVPNIGVSNPHIQRQNPTRTTIAAIASAPLAVAPPPSLQPPPVAVPITPPAEPANRPEAPPPESTSRRRNVEDRLAF